MYVPVDHPVRNCLWCDQNFKPKTRHQQFCCKLHYKYFGKKFKDHSNGIYKYQPDSRKKSFCEECGFVAEHLCQLDIDHIDGNHVNNNPDNIQTLCANCHRLKTWTNQDWTNKKAPGEVNL